MTINADRRALAVAIICPDVLLAALVGAAVELCGFRPAFPRSTEAELDALRRVRPVAVLLDADHAAAVDETLLGRALMTGARLAFFGRAESIERLRPLATRYSIDTLSFPADLSRLAALLGTSDPARRRPDSVQP